MNHLTFHELQLAATETVPEHLRVHLDACPACRSRLREFREVEAALHGIPPEHVSRDFTERVMRRLGIKGAPTFAWTLFRNLAPVLALVVVIAIAFAGLDFFGAFAGSDLQQSASQFTSISAKLATHVGGGISIFNQWMGRYFSFAFAKNTYGLTTFVVCFFCAVALLDKYVLMPKMRRKGT